MANTDQEIQELDLRLTVHDVVTVLPRCLQILSRRGFRLTQLVSTQEGAIRHLTCTIEGPVRWHGSIVLYLRRVHDVIDAQLVDATETADMEPGV